MDVFAHALWTNAVYKGVQKRERTWWEIIEIIFWSNFPDFVTFGYSTVYLIITRGFGSGEPSFLLNPPAWMVTLDRLTYSLPLYFVIFGLVWLIRRKPYWPMGGWFIHIFIDIFTHKNIFPPHFLWPFFPNIKIELVSWANPVFMTINYSALILVYGIWYFKYRKKAAAQL